MEHGKKAVEDCRSPRRFAIFPRLGSRQVVECASPLALCGAWIGPCSSGRCVGGIQSGRLKEGKEITHDWEAAKAELRRRAS